MRLFKLSASRGGACADLRRDRAAAGDWMQFGYDPAHTGNNPAETVIDATTVSHWSRNTACNSRRASTARRSIFPTSRQRAAPRIFCSRCPKNGRLMAIDAATGSEVWHVTTTGRQPTTASPALDPGREYVTATASTGSCTSIRSGTAPRSPPVAGPSGVAEGQRRERRLGPDHRQFRRRQLAVLGHRRLHRRRRQLSGPRHHDQSRHRRAGRVQHALQQPLGAFRRQRLHIAAERHLGSRRRGLSTRAPIASTSRPATAGSQGPQGSQGNQGSEGHQGIEGIQGNEGLQGTQGIEGAQGVLGAQGLEGLQGSQGSTRK